MSDLQRLAKDYGPSKRSFDADTAFSPFEVIDMGDSKVAVNEGVLVMGQSSFSFDKCQYKSDEKPQDLLGGIINEDFLLEVKKGDFVCLIVEKVGSTLPDVRLKSVPKQDLDKDEYKRKENKIFKLAEIRDSYKEGTVEYLDIKNLYVSQIIAETENWPAFTPIIWPVEKVVTNSSTPPATETSNTCPTITDANKPKYIWKAIFIPGAIYVPGAMKESKGLKTKVRIAGSNGGEDTQEYKSMLDLPVVEVEKGDEFYINYVISGGDISGEPSFDKMTTEEAAAQYDPNSGKYQLKVLTFEERLDGIEAKMFWRSDVSFGHGGSAGYVPWKPNFFTTNAGGVVYKVRFNLGTVNNVAPENWDQEHTLSNNNKRFVTLTIDSIDGKVNNLNISLETTPLTQDIIAKDTPPAQHKILLGVIDQTSGQMIEDSNLNAVGVEVFRESKGSTTVGQEPFSRWWRWQHTEV